MTLYELVKGLFQTVQERANNEVYVNCPFCSERAGKSDTKMRLGINTASGIAHCFRCEFKNGGKAKTSAARRKTMFQQLCRVFDVQYTITEEEEVEKKEENKETPKIKSAVRLPKEYEPLWKDVDDDVGKQALNYLLKRNVTKEQIKKHKIGFCAVGKYAFRIVVPIYKANKELDSFVTRDFSGQADAKYLNSDGDKTLYNLRSKKRRKDTALLVEGVFDAWACLRADLKDIDVMANLGSKLNPAQLKILKTFSRIIIWAEPDKAGVDGTIARAKQLQSKHRQVFVVVPDEDPDCDTDPGAMYPTEIRERVEGARPYTKGLAALMRTRIAFTAPPKKKKIRTAHASR